MIRFAHPEYLYILALLLPVAGLYYYASWRRRRAMETFGNPVLLGGLVRSPGKFKRGVAFSAALTALAMVILGLANPRIGSKMEEVRREGVDVVIALDVSGSMMAEDIRPNRLEHAKQNIARMLDRLQNDRVGIIVFAGQSYLQLPLTTDYGAVRLVLSTIGTDAVPVPGTALGSAIRLARECFTEGETKYKVILLVTDGENHEDDAVAEAEKAREEGVVVHAIGMGSPDGSPIPVYQDGVPAGFKKDRAGAVVISRLAGESLGRVAEAGGGVYARATNQQSEFDEIFDRIETMETKEFGTRVFTEYEDRFQYLIGPALLLTFVGFFISERRTKWRVRGLFLLLLLIPAAQDARAQDGRTLLRDGNDLYDRGRYPDAEIRYRKALEDGEEHGLKGSFNLGDALYQQGRYDAAAEQFEGALAATGDASVRAQAFHNLGNALLKGGKFEESIAAYKNALRLDPSDDDTRYNLEYAKRLLQQQQQQQQQEQQQGGDSKDDDKDRQKEREDQQQQQQQQQQRDGEDRQRPEDQQQQPDKTGARDRKQQEREEEGEERKERISRADAERILEALKKQEQDVMKKLQKKVPVRVNVEKDW